MRHKNNTPARSVKGGAPAGRFVLSNKIQPRYLDRLAIVYVRQSTAHQVAENRESATRLTTTTRSCSGSAGARPTSPVDNAQGATSSIS
jgi:hypothetical protein